jgi:hypothetical protein
VPDWQVVKFSEEGARGTPYLALFKSYIIQSGSEDITPNRSASFTRLANDPAFAHGESAWTSGKVPQ